MEALKGFDCAQTKDKDRPKFCAYHFSLFIVWKLANKSLFFEIVISVWAFFKFDTDSLHLSKTFHVETYITEISDFINQSIVGQDHQQLSLFTCYFISNFCYIDYNCSWIWIAFFSNYDLIFNTNHFSYNAVGRQYDKDGNNINWWAETTDELFEKKAQCMIDQYSNYRAHNGMKVQIIL